MHVYIYFLKNLLYEKALLTVRSNLRENMNFYKFSVRRFSLFRYKIWKTKRFVIFSENLKE